MMETAVRLTSAAPVQLISNFFRDDRIFVSGVVKGVVPFGKRLSSNKIDDHKDDRRGQDAPYDNQQQFHAIYLTNHAPKTPRRSGAHPYRRIWLRIAQIIRGFPPIFLICRALL